MINKIYKFATGDVIPLGASYLSTQVETISTSFNGETRTKNELVWHYFLVPVKEE